MLMLLAVYLAKRFLADRLGHPARPMLPNRFPLQLEIYRILVAIRPPHH